jgi:DNA (cytosine-5)-methyltransferase 1
LARNYRDEPALASPALSASIGATHDVVTEALSSDRSVPSLHEPSYDLLSLFSGAGALDHAFETAGPFTTRAAVEFQPEFCETLRRNRRLGFLADARVINCDVRTLDRAEALKCFPRRAVDGIVGGPPCESFSIRGKKLGRNDDRGTLVFEFARWVEELSPQFFVMENVPPLVTIENGKLFADLLDRFRQSGYTTFWKLLSAADYGAATYRTRVFIVGFQNSAPFVFPEPTHSGAAPAVRGALAPHYTVREALAGLPATNTLPSETPTHHVAVKHTQVVVDRFASLRSGQEDPVRKRTKVHPERPSPSVVAGNLQGTRSHIHPFEPRELTNREVARLHSFPDEFEFAGSPSAVCKQIANSVPIPLARALAAAVAQHLNSAQRGVQKSA